MLLLRRGRIALSRSYTRPKSAPIRWLSSSHTKPPPDNILPSNKTTVLEVLRHSFSGENLRYVIEDHLVMDAMRTMIQHQKSSLMVKSSDGRIVGFLTQRDLLRCIVREGKTPLASITGHQSEPTSWNVPIKQVMTPSRDLVFLSPKDTLEDARALMAVSGKRHIPVLDGSDLLGVISPKDIARALHLFRGEDISAKASYVATVMPRKGMPSNTQFIHDEEIADEERSIGRGSSFALRPAVCNLPHPHKNSMGEDAFLLGPNMIGVADGVGSWWELDVDPALYARALMHLARGSCVSLKDNQVVHLRRPRQVLHEAWHQLSASNIVGSSTACLLSLHNSKPELIAANVGDSGFLIMRRISGAKAGEGKKRSTSLGTLDIVASQKEEQGSSSMSHHVAFRSPQQLRAFNAPFQLGRAPDREAGQPDERFETPHDAALVRVPIKDGDVVVLATDGLFDNMPESDILEILQEHEESIGRNIGSSISEPSGPSSTETSLATKIAMRAQELSLDNSIDSPFAILAKDNDIMWGGGRPDDITVIVATIVDTSEHATPEQFAAFSGPGPSPELVFESAEAPSMPSAEQRGAKAKEENMAAAVGDHATNWD
jgi:protein phosphatase PTC7